MDDMYYQQVTQLIAIVDAFVNYDPDIKKTKAYADFQKVNAKVFMAVAEEKLCQSHIDEMEKAISELKFT